MNGSSQSLKDLIPVSGSFRDPKGQVAKTALGDVFRVITEVGNAEFADVEESGLYAHLIEQGKLIEHHHVPLTDVTNVSNIETLLRHPSLPMVSYPYEWCFQQMKDAALLQLDLYLESLEYGKTLSDATAYNVQFLRGKPIFIDTLSFIPYTPGQFWLGQEQFTEQFLNPLLLTSYSGLPFNDIYRGSMTGVSSEMISAVTPFRRKLSWRYFNYIHLPRQSKKRSLESGAAGVRKVEGKLPKEGFQFILKQLRSWTETLTAPEAPSTWIAYTQTRTYEDQSVSQKVKFVAECVDQARPKQVLDVGCNTGEFSFLALDAGAEHGGLRRGRLRLRLGEGQAEPLERGGRDVELQPRLTLGRSGEVEIVHERGPRVVRPRPPPAAAPRRHDPLRGAVHRQRGGRAPALGYAAAQSRLQPLLLLLLHLW